MKPRAIYAILASALGEALIIFLNILFSGDLPDNVVILNIIVCTLVFASTAWTFFIKWDQSDDNVGTWVGTLGVNLWGFSLYSCFALVALFAMNLPFIVELISGTYPVEFKYQLLVQSILLLFLIVTRFGSHAVAEQVENVHKKEDDLESGLDDMKSATRRLQDAIFVCENASPEICRMIDTMSGNIRYLSPVNSKEAKDIEEDFVPKVNALIPAFINYKMNEDSIRKQIALLIHLVDNRKRIYN